MFYYLVQDLKAFVFSLISVHFKVRNLLENHLATELTRLQIKPI